jgi:hypothetical protein
MYRGQPWTIADTHHHSRAITAERPGRSPRSASVGTGPGSFDWPKEVCVPGSLYHAVVLRLHTGLTANLHSFGIGAPEGLLSLQRHAQALALMSTACDGAV